MRQILMIVVALLALMPARASAQLDALTNVAACVMSTGYDAAATSIVVNAGCGATLPTAPYNLSWCNVTDYPVSCRTTAGDLDPNYEVVRVTARTTDTLTVTRAQESTSASTKNTSAKTYWVSTFTAKTTTDINTGLGASHITLGTNTVLTNERVLTGTSNQITVTDGGAGTTATLSTPQNIHAAATPTFGGLTVSNLTSGRVPYASTAGLLADASTLLWTNSLGRFTIGTLFDTPDQTSLAVARSYTTQTYGNITEEVRVAVEAQGSGNFTTGRVGFSARMNDSAAVTNKTITNAVSNGGPDLIRITATGHGYSTGELANVYGVGGTTEANGSWVITVIDANTFDLQGSTHTNAYTSGGTATNRGLLYGFRGFVKPTLDRDGISSSGTGQNGDDVNIFAGQNVGTGKATEAVYIASGGPSTGSQWYGIFSSSAHADYGLLLTGRGVATSTNTGQAAAMAAIWPSYIQDTATTETLRAVSIKPTLNFGAVTPNANKTLNLLDIDTINTGVTGTSTNLFKASYGGTQRALLSSAGRLVVQGTDASSSYTDAAGTSRNVNFAVDHLVNSGSFTSPLQATSFITHLDFASDPGAKVVNNVLSQITTAADSIAQASVTIRAMNPAVTHNGTGTLGTAIGNSGSITNASSGTITLAIGAQGQILNNLTGANITTSYAVRAADVGNVVGSTIGSHYGVWAGDQSGDGTHTNTPYSFFGPDTAAPSNFNHSVNIGGGATSSAVAVRATTEGTNQAKIFNGTAPVGTLTNGVSLYSTSGELRVMDSAGNATLLSPHDDETGEAIFFSQSSVTGRVFRADIEAMYRKLDAMLGGGYVTEFVGDPAQQYGGGGQGRVIFRAMPWAPYPATIQGAR